MSHFMLCVIPSSFLPIWKLLPTLLGYSYLFLLERKKFFIANGWARGERSRKSDKTYNCFLFGERGASWSLIDSG